MVCLCLGLVLVAAAGLKAAGGPSARAAFATYGLKSPRAMTVPLMSIGGRGLISVASNEIPAEMAQMVEAAERGDYAAARDQHHRLLPLMLGNFIESSPGPVKFAMSALGSSGQQQ